MHGNDVRWLTAAAHLQLALLDLLSDIGAMRHFGESRERHAERLAKQAPTFAALDSVLRRSDTASARVLQTVRV